MKWPCLLALAFLFPYFAFATSNVSGKLVADNTLGVQAGSFARLDLKNCGGNFPTAAGASILSRQDFAIAADGTWSGVLYRNDEISCNGAYPTWWTLTYFVRQQQVGPSRDYICSQPSCAFDTMTPLTVYPAPPPPAPPAIGGLSKQCSFPVTAATWTCVHNFGTRPTEVQFRDLNWNLIVPDTDVSTDINTETGTFLQPQAGYMLVLYTGNFTPTVTNPNYVISNPTSSQSVTGDYSFTLGGSLSAKRIEAIRFADQFPGGDCGAKINAADTDLGSTAGEIWVNQACGLNWTTAISLTLNHAIRLQPGLYLTSATIAVAQGAGIVCDAPQALGSGGSQGACVIKAANSANLTNVISLNGAYAFLDDLVFDGNKANSGTTGITNSLVLINRAARVEVSRVAAQNGAGHGFWVSSTAANESCCGKFWKTMSINNSGDGLLIQNTSDTMWSESEFENNLQYGVELNNAPALRFVHNDIGGNTLDGMYVYGTATGLTSNTLILVANQWGNNKQHDLRIVGYDTVGGGTTSVGNVIAANSFIGSSGRQANNTYDNIRLIDGGQNMIVGNWLASSLAPNQTKYAIETSETAAGRMLRNTITANSYNNNAGTGFYLDPVVNKSVFSANYEGNNFSQLGPGVYLVNNDCLNFKDTGGTVRCTIQYGGDNALYLKSDPTVKTINLQPNPGTNRLSVTDTLITATAPVTTNSQITSTLSTGTAPLVITSTTPVTNLVAGGNTVAIASGTATMTTAAITAGNCGTTVTVAATGVLTTDTITWAFNAAPAGTNAGLVAWPTANNANFAYCGIAETPAAATINWRVIR